MSKYVNQSNSKPKIKLNIKDTEFLLRYLMQTDIVGADIIQAATTISKLQQIQEQLMQVTLEE